jgi:hypothetical protein
MPTTKLRDWIRYGMLGYTGFSTYGYRQWSAAFPSHGGLSGFVMCRVGNKFDEKQTEMGGQCWISLMNAIEYETNKKALIVIALRR